MPYPRMKQRKVRERERKRQPNESKISKHISMEKHNAHRTISLYYTNINKPCTLPDIYPPPSLTAAITSYIHIGIYYLHFQNPFPLKHLNHVNPLM